MIKLSYNGLISLVISSLLLLVVPTIAQAKQPLKPLNIPYAKGTIKIDAELNEDIWDKALEVELDIVNNPWDNLPSPVKTTAKLIENGEYLYVAFIAYDPDPSKIQGFLGDRDTKWYDDVVGIKLDTHNNRRQNYEFFVNPYGVQNDGTFNEITGEANTLWDGNWFAYGKITSQGYQVEMAIPYNILNFKENDQEKKWAIELVRLYPRDTTLRISNVPIDRDNPCWLCQYPEAVGFKNAQIGHNIRLTPAATASRNDTKDIYNPTDDWHSEDDVEGSLDLRWGINTNNLLNATINPDFSTVESDSGQLSINTTFSLYYDEKRAFFLDNMDYFSSDYNLVYTRNIADPDYGLKLTGRTDKHSYGVFVTNDTETNFLVPGNLSSDIASLDEESNSTALRYRYDHNENISIGAISTLRTSSHYHNYLFGLDGQYRLTESDTFRAQILSSDTEYPDDLFESFCFSDDCSASQHPDCTFANCGITEQVNRTRMSDNHLSGYSDQAYKISFNHDSEYWQIKLNHENIGSDFRADLGYMPKVDIKKNTATVARNFYSEQGSLWQKASVSGEGKLQQNQNNELIERSITGSFEIDGPWQSLFDIDLVHSEKVGLRHDESNQAIDGNTTRFDENQLLFYTKFYPNNRTFLSFDLTLGDKIDYRNDRLGDLIQLAANITYNFTDHLTFDFYQTYSKLAAKNAVNVKDNVYLANLSELRLTYQFDVYSYLKLSLVYSDIDRNPDNNPFVDVSNTNKNLSSQLIYAYKLTPQTVFFLGYSDNSYQDDALDNLSREQRTFFTKISYAWTP